MRAPEVSAAKDEVLLLDEGKAPPLESPITSAPSSPLARQPVGNPPPPPPSHATLTQGLPLHVLHGGSAQNVVLCVPEAPLWTLSAPITGGVEARPARTRVRTSRAADILPSLAAPRPRHPPVAD